MEERFMPAVPAERPVPDAEHTAAPAADAVATPLTDPRALQILATEHWSLLTARSLVYNEAFTRAGMFLAFLSATLLVLGLISTATGFSDAFLLIAAVLLTLDLFIGLTTLGRIIGASNEDLRYLQGMNRLRRAYHDMVPGLEPYFITNAYDDFDSVAGFYGPRTAAPIRLIAHGFTTIPALVSVICCALASVLAAVLTLLLTHEPMAASVLAIAAFIGLLALTLALSYRAATVFAGSMEAKWPAPGARPGASFRPGARRD